MLWLSREGILDRCWAPWKLPSLPLMWIPQNGIHNRLEFLRNSTGSWKSLRDSHSSHRAYCWFLFPPGVVLLIAVARRSILGFPNRMEPENERYGTVRRAAEIAEALARSRSNWISRPSGWMSGLSMIRKPDGLALSAPRRRRSTTMRRRRIGDTWTGVTARYRGTRPVLDA